MATFKFDSENRVVYVRATVFGATNRYLRMILDPGASLVTIPRNIAIDLGLDPDLSPNRITIITAGGEVNAPVVVLPRLRAFGYEVTNLEAICMDLPPRARAEGLLGVNFLSRFRVFINYSKSFLVIQDISERGLLIRMRHLIELWKSMQ
jgi:aspartyl protease family protein